uniref:RNase NYN domain-containing protein n=1 Tax=Acrobeloides nanus TaxID=290746 RepID=A0A914EPJ5_9BILA
MAKNFGRNNLPSPARSPCFDTWPFSVSFLDVALATAIESNVKRSLQTSYGSYSLAVSHVLLVVRDSQLDWICSSSADADAFRAGHIGNRKIFDMSFNKDLINLSLECREDTIEEGPSTSAKKEPISLDELGVRRKAIIDVANVMHACNKKSAFTLPNSTARQPDAYGIFSLVHYFVSHGFDIDLVTTLGSMNEIYSENTFILKHFRRLGLLTATNDHLDDLIVLEQARCTGGFVVTNDKYRDHKNASNLEGWTEVIEKRLVPFKVFKVKIDEAQRARLGDPIKGKYFTGFNISLTPNNIATLFCQHDDPNFETVAFIRSCRSPREVELLKREIDVMADFLQQEMCQIYSVAAPKLSYFDYKNSLGTYGHFRAYAERYHYFNIDEEIFGRGKNSLPMS